MSRTTDNIIEIEESGESHSHFDLELTQLEKEILNALDIEITEHMERFSEQQPLTELRNFIVKLFEEMRDE